MSQIKDSGIKWIGKIPKEWTLKKIKYITKIPITDGPHETPVFVDEGIPFYSVDSIQNEHIVYEPCRYISGDDAKRYDKKEVPIYGDILIGKAASIGKVAVIDRNIRMQIWSPLAIIRTNEKIMHNLFLKYYLLSNSAQIEIELRSTSNTQKNIAMKDIENIIVPLADIDEQALIAKFLDDKVEKIDEILNDLNNQIELLNKYKKSLITETVTRGLNPNVELKDSGVDWIGMIPESWIENKIKYIAKVNGRVGFKGYSKDDLVGPDEGAYTIGGKHISTNKLNLDEPEYISWKKYYESPEIMIHKNDIIMAQRGTLGKVVIIEDDIGEATINPSLVLLNKIDINNKFLYWIINSDVIRENINVVNTSTAVPMISQTQIGNFKICIPPRKEQDEIVNYLDKKCKEIDDLISDKQMQIEKMEKYKKSLIYEYVTGKKRVKGAEELYG